jgi:hypothetical protein
MPHPAERNKGTIQINKWLGECRRWPLLCTVLLLTVLLVTAGSEADVTINLDHNLGRELRDEAHTTG